MKFLFKNEIIDYNFFNIGKEKTILFLHGWGGNKFSFQQTINLLKNQYNILSITMPTILPTTSVWNMFDYVELIENILSVNSIKSVIIICHSFGFRIAMLLNKKISIEKLVVTGGAGLKKENFFKKIIKNNNKTILKCVNFKNFYKKIASNDYLNLSPINKKTFKNIVNFNLKFASKFTCPMLLFWGNKDSDTPLWIARYIKNKNTSKLIVANSDHFAYLKENNKFNHEVLKFLNQ